MGGDVFEKVELPSGGWVAFRDPATLTRAHRKPITRAQTRIGMAMRDVIGNNAPVTSVPDEDMDILEGLMHAVTAALIEEWSFDVPVTPAAVDGLPDNDYEALILAAEKHRDAVLSVDAGFTPGPREDGQGNERPTGSSDVSVNTSEGIPATAGFPSQSSTPGSS